MMKKIMALQLSLSTQKNEYKLVDYAYKRELSCRNGNITSPVLVDYNKKT